MAGYTVYWIHKQEHVDIKSEGYVGITKNLTKRISEHRGGNSIIGKALRKYKDDLIIEIVRGSISVDEALCMEKDLRPKELIGWNICTGGGMPPSRKNKSSAGTKITLKGDERTPNQKAASRKLSDKLRDRPGPNSGKVMTDEQKQKIRNALKGRKMGPLSDEHRRNLSNAALNRPLFECNRCGVLANKATLGRHHKDCDIIGGSNEP